MEISKVHVYMTFIKEDIFYFLGKAEWIKLTLVKVGPGLKVHGHQ